MAGQLKNSIRAFALLFVFSANMVAGFACSVGLNLGYNRDHHSHAMEHHHGTGIDNCHAPANDVPKSRDCCSGDVTQFMLLDKSVAHFDWNAAVPVFAIPETFAVVADRAGHNPNIQRLPFRHLRRSCFLNDTELIIAVRSFRI